ncbi:MAG: GNAT family N-acetyltransferase [Pseudomonadota bacterium]|nr:GNAT family N-acetyltransferase [Pseudomonadota bacterium]
MVHAVTLESGYTISDDRARVDMTFVHASLATVYWAIGRPPELTARSFANCLVVGVYSPGGEMVGFARVLTDYAMRAHLGDVFIAPSARGRALGTALIGVILAHPELVTVWHWTLSTADAHGLYERFGFCIAAENARWMVLDRTPPAAWAIPSG